MRNDIHKDGKKTQFKKGNKIGGRTKGSINLKTRISNILESETTQFLLKQFKNVKLPETSKQNIDALIYSIFIRGVQGDTQAAKLLLEYYAGKPEQPISNDQDKPFEIIFKRIGS